MTVSDEAPTTLAAAVAFAKRFRDPAFRKYLAEIGWSGEVTIVHTTDDETVASVVSRVIFNESSSPCLITIEHPDEPFGFRFMFAEVAPPRSSWPPNWLQHKPDVINISPDTSIGMLYSSLTRCGRFVPSDWAKPVVFKGVRAAV